MRASSDADRRVFRLGAPLLLFCLALLVLAPGALAASPLKVREIFPGSTGTDPKAEYVELQMTAAGQSAISGQALQFYDAAGEPSSGYTIPSDVANGGSQRTVLLATQEAVSLFPGLPTPDFNIGSGSDRMDPAGGGVCLTGASTPDCVTWGSIPISEILTPYLPDTQLANASPIPNESALRRSIARGCATYLDVPDDTADSSADFSQVGGSPRNNAAAPTETRCPPDTLIQTSPSNPTNQTIATFTYGALPDEPGISFKCKLDSGSFESCPNDGKAYPGLGGGSHTFMVKAKGEGGEDASAKSFTWTIDTVAPNTTILSSPAKEPADGFQVDFTYQSSEASSSFTCQIDAEASQLCSAAGKSYFLLADGSHTFRVWATDQAGNQDPTPAERTFTVKNADVTPPDTTIVSTPPNPSPSDSASFTYSSNEEGSTFACSLNGSPFSSCPSSGQTYARLRNGSYLFSVRATDPAGIADSVPATYAWTVAAPLPTVKFTKAPPGSIRLKKGTTVKVLFAFKADKPGSSFRCRLDKAQFKPCSPTTKVKAPSGRHRFEVYAIDELGNVGTATARRIFQVRKPKQQGGLF